MSSDFWKFYLCLCLHLLFSLLPFSSLLCLYIFPMSMSLSAPLPNLSLALPPSLSSCFSTMMPVFPFLFLPLATAGPMVSLFPPNWITWYASPGLYGKLSHLIIPHRKDRWLGKVNFWFSLYLSPLYWWFCFIPPFRVLNIKSRGMPLSSTPLTQHLLLLLILRWDAEQGQGTICLPLPFLSCLIFPESLQLEGLGFRVFISCTCALPPKAASPRAWLPQVEGMTLLQA